MAGYIGKGQPLVSNGAEKKFKYTATAGQTTFNASYTVGSVHVYRTGVRLTDGVDYTATNGSSVTLTTGCNAGDDVVIVGTSGFQVADAFTKAELANHDQLTVDVNGRVYPKDLVDISTVGGSRLYASSMQTYTAISSISPDGASHVPHYHNSERHTIQTLGVDRLKVDSAGRVTMPYQPAFAASGTSSWHLVASGDPVVLNHEFFDIGGHYDASTGRFTAPVAGRYCFQVNVYVDVQSYTPRPCLTLNGAQVATSGDVIPYAYNSVVSPEGSMGFSYTMNLSAGDYVQLEQRIGYTTMRVYYPHSHFSGYLIG